MDSNIVIIYKASLILDLELVYKNSVRLRYKVLKHRD